MLRTFDIPISWFELIKRTVAEINRDNVLGLAAQLAFYFLLALVPAIVTVIAFTSFLPANLLQDMMRSLSGIAPPDVVTILREQLAAISEGGHTGLLTFGLLAALWSSSAAMVSIIDALNRAYDIEEGRPWWRVRLTAILLTVGASLFVVFAFAAVMIGPGIVERYASMVGMAPAFSWVWAIARWPLALVLIATGVGLVYYFAPDAEQDWEWITPGALVATLLWVAASFGFRIYVANFGSYNESYGTLGGIIVLMLWFYISGLAVLVGAEMNAEIEHASPYGKDAGEKVRGEKKKIGWAARRAWEDRRRKGVLDPASGQPAAPRPAVALATAGPSRPAIVNYAVIGAGAVAALARRIRG